MRLPVRLSPVLGAVVAASVSVAAAGPAAAAVEPQKGLGEALSAGSLLSLDAAGQSLEALRLQLPTATSSGGASALVRVTPLLQNGAPVGDPIVVPAGSSEQLPSKSAGVPGLLEVVTPSGTLAAVIGPDGPLATLTSGVGDLRLLGTDLLGEGSFSTESTVSNIKAAGTKKLLVDGLALPSLLDILDALGLDLDALPADVLLDLLDELNLLATDLISQLRELVSTLGIDSVGDLVALLESGDASAYVSDLTDAELTAILGLTDASAEDADAANALQTTIADLESALTSLTTASVNAALVGDGSSLITVPDLGTVDNGVESGIGDTIDNVLEPDTSGGFTLDPVIADLDSDGSLTALLGQLETVTTEAELVAVLEDIVAELTVMLEDLVTELINTLLGVLGGELPTVDLPALLDESLLSVGKIDVSSVARTGADEVADVTGTISDVNVLGTDVLDAVLGSSTADLASLLGSGGLGQVQTLIGDLTGSVTDILAGAGVAIPLPEIQVLNIVEELNKSGGTHTARAGVEVLRLDWALTELRIPDALSAITGDIVGGLPISAPLGGLQAQALPVDQLTALLSEDLSLVVGNLTDSSAFTAAAGTGTTVTPGTPGTNGGQLPRTGASAAAALLALAMIGGAYALRRRNNAEVVE